MTPKQPHSNSSVNPAGDTGAQPKCFRDAGKPGKAMPEASRERSAEVPNSQSRGPIKKLRNNKTPAPAPKKPTASATIAATQTQVSAEAEEPEPSWNEELSKAATTRAVTDPQGKWTDSPNVAREATTSVPRKLADEAAGWQEVDELSNVSTASSVTPETQEEVKWTSIAKKKSKPRISDTPATSFSDGKLQGVDTNGQSQSHSSQDARRDRPAPRPGYPGSPKGLPFFRKIEVGIEDDLEFRVVQRLIGPRGRYMQDITERCRGAKVWIIGKGSRSREDSVGPLMICVGATGLSEFDAAVGHINDLLSWVYKEHRRWGHHQRT